jgi:hypothetical protein
MTKKEQDRGLQSHAATERMGEEVAGFDTSASMER